MLVVYYLPATGTPYRDSECDSLITEAIARGDMLTVFCTATENLVYALRVAVAEGRATPQTVQLIAPTGTEIKLDHEGRKQNQPVGIC